MRAPRRTTAPKMKVPKTASKRRSGTHKCSEGEVLIDLAFAISNEELKKD
jgi:hypothetical protein